MDQTEAGARPAMANAQPINPGLINFRDLGGLKSRFGGLVCKDRLFRSGQVDTCKARPIDADALEFSLVVDLRYESERQRDPFDWPEFHKVRILAHGGDRDPEAPHVAAQRYSGAPGAITNFYLDFYRTLPTRSRYQGLFARALAEMVETSGRILIHCTAGKDRTGVLVALVLHALGVRREDIVTDFMRSRNAAGFDILRSGLKDRLGRIDGVVPSDAVVDELLDVRPDYVEAMLDGLERDFGSIDGYLSELGLDEGGRVALRRNLLVAGEASGRVGADADYWRGENRCP